MELSELIRKNKNIRVVGFDDAPFAAPRGSAVNISGVICSNTRFEGMLWGCAEKDGTNATEVLAAMLRQSKFYEQVHVVLIDGIAIGGFNVVDLPALAQTLKKPCIAVMRKMPDLTAIDSALKNFSDYEPRIERLKRAGEVHSLKSFYFQAQGCEAEIAAEALNRLTDTGRVPEALRLAHLIGAAVMTGQSSNRA